MHHHSDYEAIVIGTDHYNTLGLIRSLGEAGVAVNFIALFKHKAGICQSRYVRRLWKVENEASEILTVLRQNFPDKKKYVVFPTSDFSMSVLDNHLEELRTKFIVPNVNGIQGNASELMDKNTMNVFAEKAGLLIPQSWKLELMNGRFRVPEEMVYPCIAKPVSGLEGSKSDIKICKDTDELEQALSFLAPHYETIMIQEYISGEDSKMIEVIGCTTLSGKEVILPGVIEKIREFPLKAGSTSFAKVVKDSEYLDLKTLYDFLEDIGYYGLFDVEYKYAQGQAYFLEINLRNGAPGYGLTKAGINLPQIWFLDAIGSGTSHLKKQISDSFHLMSETRDIWHIRNGDLTLGGWWNDFRRTDAFLTFNLADLKPIIFEK